MNRRIVIICMAFLNSLATSQINAGIKSDYSLGLAYREDNLDWNIAHPSGSPNVLSELTWEGIRILELSFGADVYFDDDLYLRGDIATGFIFDGKNQDSDYDLDDRNGEFSRSNNDADEGETLDFSVGLGYAFDFGRQPDSTHFRLIPLVGLSRHRQNLHMTNGVQTIPDFGPFEGLNSNYKTRWQGPWVGLDMWFLYKTKSKGYFKLQYHWASYYAEANWNLREDFAHPVSFTHTADGNGVVLRTGWMHNIQQNWGIHLHIDFQSWFTGEGIDRVYTNQNTYGETKLNEVNWQSISIGAAAVYYIDK